MLPNDQIHENSQEVFPFFSIENTSSSSEIEGDFEEIVPNRNHLAYLYRKGMALSEMGEDDGEGFYYSLSTEECSEKENKDSETVGVPSFQTTILMRLLQFPQTVFARIELAVEHSAIVLTQIAGLKHPIVVMAARKAKNFSTVSILLPENLVIKYIIYMLNSQYFYH
ncbi:hypothetical protein HZS_2236 [Henneguya salminicola]|nr:hypothetical protein HZS_2236 [Henneguya salminicola]